MSDVKILAIVGSLRKGAVNRAVARAAVAAAPPGVEVEIVDLRPMPFYDGDVEAAGLPTAVQEFHDAVAAADGLVFFSPEYNGSFPAVTKNAIDWLTRPPRSWVDRAISMVTASPGPRAGLGVRSHFEAIMEFQPVRVYPTLGIGEYGDKMTGDDLTDEATLDELAQFVAGFAQFCTNPPQADGAA